jgi:toxin-antitoxin system PIN domain toxin
MFVVDTNLLIYAANRRAEEHASALEMLSRWRSGSEAWFATWSILYEFLRIATHFRVFERPLTFSKAWNFIEELLSAPSFGLLTESNRHADILRDLVGEYPRISANRFHDLHIAALMKEHGIAEIRTADRDFHEFRFLRVVNPLLTRRP